ncbi:MAG: hypothetical protein N3D11_00080 [Candidatus Sumerlaeia bacterium]|nr:hypothetical protein [Candidatus Sumerlaeia bacterium]
MTATACAGTVAAMNAASDTSAKALRIPAVLLVVAAAFSYGFVPERADNDVWWHLKTGKLIVEGRHLPATDPFTFTAENLPWHNHEWLAQAVFYQIFHWGGGVAANLIGLRALIAFKSVLLALAWLLLLWLVHERCRSATLAAGIALLALDVSRYTLYPRPPVFTYFLMAVFLLVLQKWKTRQWPPAVLLALPPATALWANLHGGFLVGLILVALYGAGEVAEHFWWKGEAAGAGWAVPLRHRLSWLGGVFLACLAASLCTPYHYHLYELPFRVMSSTALVKTIAEMRSPLDPAVARFYLSFFLMAVLLVSGLAAARYLGAARPPAADLFILLFFGYQAARHTRHLPLFAIACAPILGHAAGQILDRYGELVRRRIAWIAAAVLIAAFVYLGGVRHFPETYWNRNRHLARGVTYIEINFPKEVCDFIERNDFSGRMFNPVNCAGYLIWRLSPELHKIFTDSRFDIFGDQFIWHEWAVRHGIEREDWDRIAWERLGLTEREGRHVRERCGGDGWAEILDRWQINYVIAERSWPGLNKLRGATQWESVFQWIKPFEPREGYEIFIRRTPENFALISNCRRLFEEYQRRYRAERRAEAPARRQRELPAPPFEKPGKNTTP